MKTLDLLAKARSFAFENFSKTQRKSGDNLYQHAERVFTILTNNSIKDEVTLAASLLHPIVDEINFDLEKIEDEFGTEVVAILNNYAKLKRSKIDKETPRAYNEAFFIQTFLKLSGDTSTLVIRLADRLDNLKTSYALPKEKRIVAAQKVLYLYSLIAKAVGLGKLSREMEDEAFRILDPREYKNLEKLLDLKIEKAGDLLEDAHNYLEEVFKENKIEAGIYTRFKHKYGIYRKLLHIRKQDKSILDGFKDLHDVAGMRIIVDTLEQCYEVENILLNTWDSYSALRDDYIVKPRHSGYQSLHGTYKIAKNLDVEIQIRTNDMHKFNEFGPASHLLYKIGDKGTESLAHKKLLNYVNINKYWFKELDLGDGDSLAADESKNVLFDKNIYCFTPKGDIIELPIGATIIDFAYSLHSDLGDRCSGAFINGQFVGLDHTISDGDLVEIKTINKKNVNRDWLKIAKTSKTRAHIRKALKD